ncbi:MAG: hypothetical protein KBD51_00090 [Candidatus Levybacteria bacterium]|nr:hypothetical protein [Candidatus Levybacteria bacterium]
MAGSHEGPTPPGVGDQRIPWQIPQDYTDTQILEHLKAVPRPFSTELAFVYPDQLVIPDALLLRFTREDMVLEFKEMRREKGSSAAMRVGRPRDLFIIASHFGDISARYSRPVLDKGEFVTGRFNMSMKPDAEVEVFIGESYRLSDPHIDTVGDERSLVVSLESNRRIESVEQVPEYIKDYETYLAELAKLRSPKPR